MPRSIASKAKAKTSQSSARAVPRMRGPKATKVDPGRILDAAQDVFGREGLQGSSIRAIARGVGCDPALIYYHFESKEAMFLALLERKIEPLATDLERQADAADLRPSSQRLWAILQTYKAHFSSDSGFRSMLRGEILRGAEGMRDAMAVHIRRTAGCVWKVFKQGQERGELRSDLHPPLITFFFIRTYMEILDLVPVMGSRLNLVEPAQAVPTAEREWFRLFWRGIAADPLPALPPGLWSQSAPPASESS